ncbi:sodium:solute symporter [candidate division KSB1 bacterium]|nr:sodium:solute symporter [candidate division KSB1 bacterium]
MNLTLIDWTIVIGILAIMIGGVVMSRSRMRSVADFLAAGRTAGRYVLSISGGIAALGAITIVANMEMNYKAGFVMSFWGMSSGIFFLILTAAGWVIYRFRQTRALTLAQFFEMRYSRKFRIFAGMLSFFAGIINFGIFPAVGARFFIYFCGLPQSFSLLGIEISTFPLAMIVLLSLSLYFVFSGGQIAVIITDFIQGMFVNIVFVILLVYIFLWIDWSQIYEALITAPENESLINPFKTSRVEDFNFWYFLIGLLGGAYSAMSWQGAQGYNTSAKSAHEAKMAGMLGGWRAVPQNVLLLFLPIVAYTIMHHPEFLNIAKKVNSTLTGVETDAIKSQLTVPLVLTHILPRGLMGSFAAVMVAAFISTHDTYLHSWGSILIQDVIMPFRKKPFKPEQHIRILRLSILGVAIFIFFFSFLFKQSQYIMLFFAITGAIFAGGSGSVIIGGLYWKRGTTAAAWAALITGSSIAVGGIILHQLHEKFFINGQEFWALSMACSLFVYILVSLLGKKQVFDMDRLLHRGDYAIKDETLIITPEPGRGLKLLGMGKEFTRGDKLIYFITYAWTIAWTIVFIIGTVYNLTHDVPDSSWMKFWKVNILIHVVLAIVSIIWFVIGGINDIKAMFKKLGTMERDDTDDGFVDER